MYVYLYFWYGDVTTVILHNQRGQVSDGIFWTCSCDVDAMGMWEWWISFIGILDTRQLKMMILGVLSFFLISLRQLRENEGKRGLFPGKAVGCPCTFTSRKCIWKIGICHKNIIWTSWKIVIDLGFVHIFFSLYHPWPSNGRKRPKIQCGLSGLSRRRIVGFRDSRNVIQTTH